jgi:hypothetical protein
MAEKKYPEGLWANPPHERAPDFIVCTISISKERFAKWLDLQAADAKGYIKLDVKKSREGDKYNVEINTYRSTARAENRDADRQNERRGFADLEDDIPF